MENKTRVNEHSGSRDCYAAMVQDIKLAINAIASIYPTAFDLYDEPLDRLAHRLGHLFRDKYGDSFSVEEAVRKMNESAE
jgi:Zn-dependent peptidase ImmA (M78 family)